MVLHQKFTLPSAPIVISNPKIVHELISDIAESIALRSIQRNLSQLRSLMSGVFCHEPDGTSEGFISCQHFIRRFNSVKGWSTSHAQRVGPCTFAAVRFAQ